MLLLPFIFELGTEDEMRLPKAKFLALLAMLYGSYCLLKRINWPLGLFAAIVSISAFFSKTGFPFQDIVLFWGALVSAFWVANLKDEQLYAGLKIFEASALIAALYSIVQISGLDPFIHYYPWAENWRPTVLFGQHTLYGPFAVAGFLVALFLRHYAVALITLFPIIVINSSFTFLSLLGGLFFWAFFNYRKALIHMAVFVSLLGIVASAFYPNKVAEGLNDKGRFRLWGQTIYLSNREPVFGHGFGTFKEIYPLFQVPELRKRNGLIDEELSPSTRAFIKEAENIKAESGVFLSAHNDFLQVIFEHGAVGALAALSMVLYFAVAASQSTHAFGHPLLIAMAASFLLNSLGSFPFRLIPQALIPLWVYVIITTRSVKMYYARRHAWPKSFAQMSFIALKTSFSTWLANTVTSRIKPKQK